MFFQDLICSEFIPCLFHSNQLMLSILCKTIFQCSFRSMTFIWMRLPNIKSFTLMVMEISSEFISNKLSRLLCKFFHNSFLSLRLVLNNIFHWSNLFTLFSNYISNIIFNFNSFLFRKHFTKFNPFKKSFSFLSLISSMIHTIECSFNHFEVVSILSPCTINLLLHSVVGRLDEILTSFHCESFQIFFFQLVSVSIKCLS